MPSFLCTATVRLLQSSQLFQTILSNHYYCIAFVNPKKNTCENRGTETTRNDIVRHKKRFSVGTLYCTQCLNFSTKSQKDLNYHIAKKHNARRPAVTFKCKLCSQEFPGFYASRQHRITQHGMQIGSRTIDVNVEHIVGDVEDHRLKEVLRSC